MKPFLIISSLIILSACADQPTPGKQVFIEKPGIVDGYWLYLPENHSSNKSWPVIFFLSGGAAASHDIRTSQNEGPFRFLQHPKINQYLANEYIIINPHMTAGLMETRQWFQYDDQLMAILTEVEQKYNADLSQVHLTGLSRGARGAWVLAKKHPNRFATLAVVAGRISCNSNCEKITDIPTWVVHHTKDPSVNFDHSKSAVNKLEQILGRSFIRQKTIESPGSEHHVFTYPEADTHDAWNAFYSDESYYQWLKTQSK